MTPTMEFDCKLAHADGMRRLSNFKSLKELYEQIGKSFSVPMEEILYCTLNTHNFRDMDAILANHISHGDIIIAHLCGKVKDLNLTKTQEYLGLTITDNGHGRAFVKRVKSDQEVVETNIRPGDHIASINGESTVGLRHYEVAKAIREIPQGSNFAMRLVEPRYCDEYLKADTGGEIVDSIETYLKNARNGNTSPVLEFRSTSSGNDSMRTIKANDSLRLSNSDSLNSSLPMEKLLSKRVLDRDGFRTTWNDKSVKRVQESDAHQERVDFERDEYTIVIEKLNDILESFLGINDYLLAIQIYRLARESKDSYPMFLESLQKSDLRVFDFDEDMKSYLWNCAINR